MSREYISAIAILLVAVLKLFGVEIGSDVISSVIVGILAIYVAIRRHGKGDINLLGARK